MPKQTLRPPAFASGILKACGNGHAFFCCRIEALARWANGFYHTSSVSLRLTPSPQGEGMECGAVPQGDAKPVCSIASTPCRRKLASRPREAMHPRFMTHPPVGLAQKTYRHNVDAPLEKQPHRLGLRRPTSPYTGEAMGGGTLRFLTQFPVGHRQKPCRHDVCAPPKSLPLEGKVSATADG